ncbi:MAG: class I SAM-dependent methyltransferase [Woeseiaceae bacterium]
MTNENPEPFPVIESWDTYWQGAESSAAYTGGGSSHPLVLSFWLDYFRDVQNRDGKPKIIDIASGNGAVVESANTVFGGQLPAFTCLDVSESAILMLEKRFPGVHGIVADAAEIPLDSASYDIATSQFGVEYAGLEAVEEMVRLLAPGGELTLLMHHHGGIIFQECGASLDAIRDMQDANFIPACMAMFEAGYEALQGGDPARYGAAGKQFAPALQAMEAIMVQYGREVAASTILKIYRDVRTIHGRMRHYEPSAVLGWLEKMKTAIEAYTGRMASMRNAAIDATRFKQLCTDLTDKNFDILRAEPLARSNQDQPVAWVLISKKE